MNDVSLKQLWNEAAGMDRSLRINSSQMTRLKKKLVRSRPFSRARMFDDMAERRVSILRDVPVLLEEFAGESSSDSLLRSLGRKFPPRLKARVQVGPSRRVSYLPVREVIRRWLGGRAIVGVTDLHIRGTKAEEVIDTKALSDFSTLIRGSDDLAVQEMMTLVIASRGNVTDSHTDDPDGTNHCFFGKKLWLTWDTFEGMSVGLEDVERQDVYEQCSFDMTRFLSIKSSRWFLISADETLFLPGNLAHKVVTLEPYFGVGSFHIGLPSCFDSFSRWLFHGPLWSMDDPKQENAHLVDEAIRATLKIAKRAACGSQNVKDRWGYDYMNSAYLSWNRTESSKVRERSLEHKDFRKLIEIAASARPARKRNLLTSK